MKPIRIELPTDFAVGSVNAYLFTEPEPVLVDTGVKSAASRDGLIAGLAKVGLALSDLSQVIITHPHVDHFGQARHITRQSNAIIRVSVLGKRWLVDFPDMWRRRIAYYRDDFMTHLGFQPEVVSAILGFMDGVLQVCDPVPEERVSTFGINDVIEMGGMHWQVIHTPGHASHQTCFYQRETRQLISADMLLPRAPTPIVERPPTGSERVPSLPVFMESLSLVEALDIDSVFPGHGAPFGDHRRIVRAQRERIAGRMEECRRHIADGLTTVADLVNRMYAHLPVEFRFAGLWMLVGYLDLLLQEGVIVKEGGSGLWSFVPAPRRQARFEGAMDDHQGERNGTSR
jgi:glyoxylase-like metal-dependent hydrolase (beta-lactamase superfamily II)